MKVAVISQLYPMMMGTEYYPSQSSNCLKFYFNMGYYLGLLPYRIVTKGGSSVQLKSNKVWKFVVGILHCYTLMTHVKWWGIAIYLHLPRITAEPIHMYHVASHLSHVLGTFCFLYITWLKKAQWISLSQQLDLVHILPLRPNRRNSLKSLFWSWLSAVTVLIFVILAAIYATRVPENHFVQGPLQYYVEKAVSSHAVALQAVRTIYFVLYLYSILMDNYAGYFIVNCCCTIVYHLGSECHIFIQQHGESVCLEQTMQLYRNLKKVITSLNELVGVPILFAVAGILTHFSRVLLTMFSDHQVLGRIADSTWLTMSVIYLCLAAKGSKALGEIGDYVFDKHGSTPCALALMHNSSSHPLGLKAYEFTINFGFIVSIFSTVLTYAIILQQFQYSLKNVA